MRLDLEIYKVNKEVARRWYEQKGRLDPKSAISNMSMLTGVPCIVSAYWIGEFDNWPEYVVKSIIRLKEFYNYEEIVNTPIGAPV